MKSKLSRKSSDFDPGLQNSKQTSSNTSFYCLDRNPELHHKICKTKWFMLASMIFKIFLVSFIDNSPVHAILVNIAKSHQRDTI